MAKGALKRPFSLEHAHDQPALNGSERRRSPVRVKRAFASAGAMGGVPGSPTPPGGRSL
jgi:hypothetical protein